MHMPIFSRFFNWDRIEKLEKRIDALEKSLSEHLEMSRAASIRIPININKKAVSTYELCPNCAGKGYVYNSNSTCGQMVCSNCNGSGRILIKTTVEE